MRGRGAFRTREMPRRLHGTFALCYLYPKAKQSDLQRAIWRFHLRYRNKLAEKAKIALQNPLGMFYNGRQNIYVTDIFLADKEEKRR